MEKRIWKIAFLSMMILCFSALDLTYAQQQKEQKREQIGKKVGGDDIKFEATTSKLGPVIFSHENHVNKAKKKCTDCHTKIFKMKKGADKLTQASFAEGKYCGACHDGKKAFSAIAKSDCAKCHKK